MMNIDKNDEYIAEWMDWWIYCSLNVLMNILLNKCIDEYIAK